MEYEEAEVERIFQRARLLPSTIEREAFLDSACAGNPPLRTRVDTLLRAERSAGGFLATADTDAGPAPAGEPTGSGPLERPGSTISRYRLLQQIGEGGFGVVFLAEQTEPVVRRVALKIVKAGMDTRQVLARFDAERQALAMMEHPNIAGVLDAGATEGGRPYFVMELVKGVPITTYADDNILTVRDRLRLLRPVCDAVQHAHQKGVIHRDLKPSNVLVTLINGKPSPKVIDFGIAKATSRKLTEQTLFTQYGQLVGTPQYMSPEQAEMSGLDVDTRTDVYSLGVLLYELLTGTTPLDAETLRRAGLDEIRRLIREAPTPKPSTKITTLESLPDVAAHRQAEPGKLGVLLRGDLDWIVLKALEKDRARRYETASDLGEDIRRFLDHEPVTASPPSTIYVMRKFVRRHRRPVIAAMVMALLLIGGMVGTSAGLVASMRANTALDHTLARANEVKQLISGMLTSIRPEHARGTDITLLKEILDRTARRLTAGEIEDPLIAAELHQLIGDSYRRLGLYEQADRHLPEAVRLRERTLGPADPLTLQAVNLMGNLRHAQDRLQEAERLYRQVLSRIGGAASEQPIDFRARSNLAQVLSDMGSFEDAEVIMTRLVDRVRSAAAPIDEDAVRVMQNLALLYLRQGRYEDCEEVLDDAFERARGRIEPDHPALLKMRGQLATLHYFTGELQEARRHFRELWSMQKLVLSPTHPDTLDSLNGIAVVELSLGRYEAAESLFEEALRLHEQAYDTITADTLKIMNNLALTYGHQQRDEEAEELFRKVLEHERDRRPGHPEMLKTAVNLAMVLTDLERYDEAEALFLETYEQQKRALPPGHPDFLSTLGNLARLRMQQARYDEAVPLLLEVLDARRKALGPGNPSTLLPLANLALAYLELDRPAEAAELLEEGLPLMRAAVGDESDRTQFMVTALARAYEATEEPGKALLLRREQLEHQLAAAQRLDAPSRALTDAASSLLTLRHESLRDPPQALELARRAVRSAEAAGGQELAAALHVLALAQHMTGDTAAAVENQRQALELLSDDDSERPEYEAQLAKFTTALDGAPLRAVSDDRAEGEGE